VYLVGQFYPVTMPDIGVWCFHQEKPDFPTGDNWR
jgi:hypothetical protein